MTMYNKIFTKILDSSIWLESDATRIVWVTMIAAMDETGFCQFASAANVARRANVDPEKAAAAIAVLEAPDADSSDPENEGRRIERVPGGWIVLNAEKYRAIVTRAVNQEQTRQRVARFRSKKLGVTGCNDDVTLANGSVTPSEAVSEAKTKTPKTKATTAALAAPEFPEWVDISAFNAFLAMRKKLRKPVTDEGIQLCIKKLGSLRNAGNDPTAVLNQSTMNSWQGLFPIKEQQNGASNAQRPYESVRERNLRLAIEAERLDSQTSLADG
jgi:hypothetical protein